MIVVNLAHLNNKSFGVKTKINIFFWFFWECSRPEAKCQQPPFLTESFKPNLTYQIRYSYHTGRRACQPFLLYGHDGEATRWVNRFKTLQDCQSLCRYVQNSIKLLTTDQEQRKRVGHLDTSQQFFWQMNVNLEYSNRRLKHSLAPSIRCLLQPGKTSVQNNFSPKTKFSKVSFLIISCL